MIKTSITDITVLDLPDIKWGNEGHFSMSSIGLIWEDGLKDLIRKLQITLEDLDEDERKIFDPTYYREEIATDYNMASMVMRFIDRKIITWDVYSALIDIFTYGLDTKRTCGWFQNETSFGKFTIFTYTDVLLVNMCTDYYSNGVTFMVVNKPRNRELP